MEQRYLSRQETRKPRPPEHTRFGIEFEPVYRLVDAALVNENIAYLAGAAEDAHLGHGGKEGYILDIESKSERWLTKVIKPILEQELPEGREVQVKQRGTRPESRIQIWNRELVQLVQTIHEHPQIILTWDKPQQHAWVRGLADAEGTATCNSQGQPQFSIYNRSLEKLQIAGQILRHDNIHCGYYLPPGRDVWQMFITGHENLQRFLDEGPGVTHPEKREKLRSLLAE